MNRVGKRAGLGAVAVALAMTGVALAGGEETTVTARLNASASGDAIAGKVKSDKNVCTKRRKVKLTYRDAPAPRETIGTDETDNRGNYRVALDGFAPPGTYTATAKGVTVEGVDCKKGTGVYEHTCGGGPAPGGGDHG